MKNISNGKLLVFCRNNSQMTYRLSFVAVAVFFISSFGYTHPFNRLKGPFDGNVEIYGPSNGTVFKKSDQVRFKWSAPDNKEPDQLVSYYFKIVKLEENQSPETAIIANDAWFERTTNAVISPSYSFRLLQTLDPNADYAWQVTAFAEEGYEMAYSDVYRFKGPNVIEDFYAGRHLVEVVATENLDLTNLSGICRIQVGAEDTLTVPFQNLNVEPVGSIFHRLVGGEITYEYEESQTISLSPHDEVAENGNASFYLQQLRLDTEGLAALGFAEWQVPLATTQEKPVYLRTETIWANYDQYLPSGYSQLSSEVSIELIDPQGFGLLIAQSSQILMLLDHYEVVMDGDVLLPSSISGQGEESAKLSFTRTKQLFYFHQEKSNSDTIALVPTTALGMVPRSFTVDFSSAQSPGELSADAQWKGVQVEAFDLVFPPQLSIQQGLTLNDTEKATYALSEEHRFTNRMDASGLDFSVVADLSLDGALHVYPAAMTKLTVDITDSSPAQGAIQGKVLIPSYHPTDSLPYTLTISDGKVSSSYLDAINGQRTLLQAPFIATATDTTHKSFVARWFAVSGAISYDLEVSTDNFATLASDVNYNIQSDTTATINGLQPNTDYQYRVKASRNENILISLIARQRTLLLPTAPLAPANLRADPLENGSVRLYWDDLSDNEAYFVVERASRAGEGFIEITQIPANKDDFKVSYTDEDAPAGGRSYRVKAINDGGSSEYITISDVVLSVQDDLMASALDIYPNPAQEAVTITAPQHIVSITLTNLQGRLLTHYDNPQRQLRLPELPVGVYLLQVRFDGNRTVVRKLMVGY